MFISILVVARNPDDIQALSKTDSRKLQGVYFGLDVRRGGNFVYLTEQKRLTTCKFDDCTAAKYSYLIAIIIDPSIKLYIFSIFLLYLPQMAA